jgi:hypothetical protein
VENLLRLLSYRDKKVAWVVRWRETPFYLDYHEHVDICAYTDYDCWIIFMAEKISKNAA